MIERFKAKLQKAQQEYLDLYQSYCSSYVLAIKFLVNGNNNELVHIIIEAFPKRKNDVLTDQSFFREILGNLPYDFKEIEDIITYCFDTFQNNNKYSLTPVIPYTIYSYFRNNGGVTAENFISLIEDCIINDDFSIMKNGFGLRIAFFGKNNNVFRSYENPAV